MTPCAVEAQRLDGLRLVATEERVEADLLEGRHAELVGELEALVAEHPLRERLWAQLMRCLYRSGRQADALRAYERLRRQLADELGLEPSPEVVQLERDILAHAPSLAWSPPGSPSGSTDRLRTPRPFAASPSSPSERTRHNLPVPRGSLIGRDAEVSAVAAAVVGAPSRDAAGDRRDR